jgi:hypothetical protein
VVLDRSETVIGELGVSADGRQRDRLLEFAAAFTPRTWAIESASGLGALLAQQLVAAGETVLDVPPTLSARVRLLDAGTTVPRSTGSARWAPRSSWATRTLLRHRSRCWEVRRGRESLRTAVLDTASAYMASSPPP